MRHKAFQHIIGASLREPQVAGRRARRSAAAAHNHLDRVACPVKAGSLVEKRHILLPHGCAAGIEV
jgi:hypothetical protein